MSRPIIDGILTMSNHAVNKTSTPLIILLLEQNTLGPINSIQSYFILKWKIKKKINK